MYIVYFPNGCPNSFSLQRQIDARAIILDETIENWILLFQTYYTLQRHHRVHLHHHYHANRFQFYTVWAQSHRWNACNMQCIYNSRLNFKLQFSTQRIKTHNYWYSIYVYAPDIIRLTKIKFKLEYIIKVRSIIYYWMHIS